MVTFFCLLIIGYLLYVIIHPPRPIPPINMEVVLYICRDVFFKSMRQYAGFLKTTLAQSIFDFKIEYYCDKGIPHIFVTMPKQYIVADNGVITEEMQNILNAILQKIWEAGDYDNGYEMYDPDYPLFYVFQIQDAAPHAILEVVILNYSNTAELVKESKHNAVTAKIKPLKNTIPKQDVSKGIYLGQDLDLLDIGIRSNICWDYSKYAHMAIFGGTGTGKTYFSKQLIGQIKLQVPDAKITICDFKGEDFSYLKGCNRYYELDDTLEGFKDFYNNFYNRWKKLDDSRQCCILLFEEWASFVSAFDKKEADKLKKMLADMLRLGRSMNIHLIISQQRADAEYFDKARDNFSVIVALGEISKEAKQMFFSEYKEDVKDNCDRGEGNIHINGQGLKHLKVDKVTQQEKLDYYVKLAVS